MNISRNLLEELQNRLKVGNRRGVHLNAVPGRSKYKFDITRLSYIDETLPDRFLEELLTNLPLKFKISWKDNVPDLNSLFEQDQIDLVKITKSLENLINQTDTIESEKGINTFGFGYPILVRRDRLDNKLTVAPILIWSLRIKRTKEFNTWQVLRDENDPIYINEVLINHLQSDSQIEINQLSSEHLEDGLIDRQELVEICTTIIKAINTKVDPNIESIFKEKTRNISQIRDQKHYEKLPITSNSSLIEFGGLFSIFEVQKQNIINDYDNLLELEGLSINLEDFHNHHFQPLSSVSTDPSQQGILNSLAKNRNLLIQGPPGTGKSQTLSAILVNALENGQRTIVVCEKQTALEVLQKSLEERNLGAHCITIKDIIKDRRSSVNSVRDRVDTKGSNFRPVGSSKDKLNSIIEKVNFLINRINSGHIRLDQKIIGDKNWTAIVGDLLSQLRNSDVNPNVGNLLDFKFELDEFEHFLKLIEEGSRAYLEYKTSSELTFLNTIKYYGDNPFALEDNLKQNIEFYNESLIAIVDENDKCRNEYLKRRADQFSVQSDELMNSISKVLDQENKLHRILSLSKDKFVRFREEELNTLFSKVNKLIDSINQLFNQNVGNKYFEEEGSVKGFGFRIKSIFSKKAKHTKDVVERLNNLFSDLESTLSNSTDLNSLFFSGALSDKKSALLSVEANMRSINSTFIEVTNNEFLDFGFHSLHDNPKAVLTKVQVVCNNSKDEKKQLLQTLISDMRAHLDQNSSTLNIFLNKLSECKDVSSNVNLANSFNENKQELLRLQPIIHTEKNNIVDKASKEYDNNNFLFKYDEIQQRLDSNENRSKELINRINSDNWISVNSTSENTSTFIKQINPILIKCQEFINSDEDLFRNEFNWFSFYNGLNPDETKLIDKLKDKEEWKKEFTVNYLHRALIHYANVDLPVKDNYHKDLDLALDELKGEQVNYINKLWYSKQLKIAKEFNESNTNLNVANLYNKKKSKNHRRLSLRRIVEFDTELFTTFFPVILTTPDVASNLFKHKRDYFDIVMFDEASQLRLEDTLPALLKGKQIVIAGDEHQMPPSNYFSKNFEGDVDDDDIEEDDDGTTLLTDDILSCESLLEVGAQLNFKKLHLDFHYRSKHPYLIDFSNYAFYKQRLKPLPSTIDYEPISYINTGGTYADRSNNTEADTVISILENNIHRLPDGEYPTIGVATFNTVQRNLILEKINSRRKFLEFSDFNDKISELEENGFFVKNLENIQGDERDVIILSTTYGVNSDGKFAQRFGSINQQKGYKLLNVIITRAKYKVYTVTSIPEEYILNYRELLQSEGSNNKRAVFFAYIAYCKAVSEQNEDARIGVLKALQSNYTTSSKNDGTAIFNADLESPFEEEVYSYLIDHISEDQLFPQFKFAGFRIDLVYKSKNPLIPRIAIECDGAAYHSSQEAYLHDKYRQNILEDNGFVFHRIWSTNWWKNPNKEMKKLVEFIKLVESMPESKDAGRSKVSDAFIHDVNDDFQSTMVADPIINKKTKIIANSISSNVQVNAKSVSNTASIKLNSIVTVKYLNKDKDISIKLVNHTNGVKKNGIQEVNIDSPLGRSLITKTVGETVKVGALDNYVQVLKIEQ